MMGAPATQEDMSSRSSQRRMKGTIASRYLEAIGFQCGGNLDAGYRSTPIVKNHNDATLDNHYHNINYPKKNQNRAVRSSTVYDKISASAKAADCSNRSIITASTAVMLDHSDSLSTTTATSPGGSAIGKFLRGSPQRVVNRRGRSPTPIKSGTNSIGSSASSNSSRSRSLGNVTPRSHTTKYDDYNSNQINLSGSRTTAPLSDGVVSAPSTPTRFNQRRHHHQEGQRIRTRSWSDHTKRSISNKSGGVSKPITPLTAKSIMGIDNSNSGSDYSYPDSRLGFTPPPNMRNEASPLLSLQSACVRGRGFRTNTNPRMPSGSPGPQPRSPRHAYSHAEHQEHGQSRSLFEQIRIKNYHMHSSYQRDDDLTHWSHNEPYPDQVKDAVKAVKAALTSLHKESQSTVLEGEAHTKRTKNLGSINRSYHLRRPSAGTDEATLPPSTYHSEPTDSEAGAPTEITKNHKFVDRPSHLRRPSDGDGGNQLLLKNRPGSRNVDILSRVQSRFQNTNKDDQEKQQHHVQRNGAVNASLPSLFDTQSSSVSSAVPVYSEQKEAAYALNLSPFLATETPSRLSRHVENARKKSIWSPSASETTGTVNSIGNDANVISSLTTEVGSSQDQRIIGKPLASLLSTKTAVIENKTETSAPKVGGLLRGSVVTRVAALEAHYRKGNITVRGARSHQGDKQNQHIEEQTEDLKDDEDFPDPILSLSHTMEDNDVQYNEEDTGNDSDDYYSDQGQIFDEASTNNSGDSGIFELYEDDDDESTIPEFNSNENHGGSVTTDFKKDHVAEFVAYNDRQSPNIDGVFQLNLREERSKPKKSSRSANKKVRRSRAHDREGKSPIQLLFSSERLDENNNASIRESSIRSKSLGRSSTTKQFLNSANCKSFHPSSSTENYEVLPRRSKSLSERRIYHQPMLSVKKAEAMRIIARNHRMKEEKISEQDYFQKAMPRKIVMENEISKSFDGSEAIEFESSSVQPITVVDSSQTLRRYCAGQSSTIEIEDEDSKSPRNQDIPIREGKASIKDKIRTYNLRKSPIPYTSIGTLSQEKPSNIREQKDVHQDSSSVQKENSRDRKILRNDVNEKRNEGVRRTEPLEKNVDHCNGKTKLMNSQRKSIWTRHLAEKAKNDDSDSTLSKTDDYSVQSLREQFEQKKNNSPFDEDDDDRSVKCIREVFESPEKKQTGETISNLKAKFERKPTAFRLSFAKNARSRRKGNRGIQGSSLNAGGKGKILDEASIRKESDLAERKEENKESDTSVPKQTSQSFEWRKLQDEDPKKVDGINIVETSPMFNSVHNRLNEWSKRRQIERKSIAIHPVEQRQIDNDTNQAIGGGLSSDDKSKRTRIGMGTGNKTSSSNLTVFGAVETRQSPLKDANRGIPGSHWASQGAMSDRDNAIQKKGTKESSFDSEYSDAVTLDPSFADVSNLSTPSAIRSLPSSDIERRSDTSGSSVLFENLEDKAFSGEIDGAHGASSSGIAPPQFSPLGRVTSNGKALTKTSNATYRDSTLQNATRSTNLAVTQDTEYSDVGGSQVSGYDPKNRAHSFTGREEKVHLIEHNDRPATVSNDTYSGYNAQANILGNLHHPYESINQNRNDSSRSMLSSRSPKSSNNTVDYPNQDSEASNRSTENTFEDAKYSTRSSKSSDPPEPSYSPVRYRDNRKTDADSSNRSSGPMDTSSRRELPDSFFLSNHSFEKHRRSLNLSRHVSESRKIESPNRSTRSSNNSSPLPSREKATQLDSKVQNDDNSPRSSNRNRNQSIVSSRRKETLSPKSQPFFVPPMPSPFDENYATIMESRHKMLLVRQRTLLERRATRDKIHNKNLHQGFFIKTNPGMVYSSVSPSTSSNQEPTMLADAKEHVEFNVPKHSKTYDPFNSLPARRSEELQPRSPIAKMHATPLVKEKNKPLVPQSSVASILSRIRPSFGRYGRRDEGISQKQAVIHRISAVRAARLRSNQVYGGTSGSKNYEPSEAYRMSEVKPGELETVGKSISAHIPGYRYYPHDESVEMRGRDDDQSLSTNESNAQEYAAKLSVD